MSTKRKMPRRLQDLFRQLYAHPSCKHWSDELLRQVDAMSLGCSIHPNRVARQLWQDLYENPETPKVINSRLFTCKDCCFKVVHKFTVPELVAQLQQSGVFEQVISGFPATGVRYCTQTIALERGDYVADLLKLRDVLSVMKFRSIAIIEQNGVRFAMYFETPK